MSSTQLCLIKLVFIISAIRCFQTLVFDFNSFRYESIGTRIRRACMSVSMSHSTKDTALSMSEQRDGDLSGFCSPTGIILKYRAVIRYILSLDRTRNTEDQAFLFWRILIHVAIDMSKKIK